MTVIFTAALSQAPTLLQNARIIPEEFKITISQFRSWVKEDNEWTGHWSSFPEGFVDLADMQLTETDLEITIWATEGYIDGTIATKKVCETLPIVDYFLLRGEVSGDKANVVAWDIIKGHKTDFAELILERKNGVITVTPKSGHTDLFPAIARIGQHPLEPGEDPKPTSDYCKEEREEFRKMVRSLLNSNGG